jgi:hypothetical protein
VLAPFRDVARPDCRSDLFALGYPDGPKYHPTPLSGGDRKALGKELGKARAMTRILAAQSTEMRTKGEAMLREADRLLCESWNERTQNATSGLSAEPDRAYSAKFLARRIPALLVRRFFAIWMTSFRHRSSDSTT